jgi:hypothetical protein
MKYTMAMIEPLKKKVSLISRNGKREYVIITVNTVEKLAQLRRCLTLLFGHP